MNSLDDLFDIPGVNAMTSLRNEEDKQFLLLQRQKGRPRCMIGVDFCFAAKEQLSQERRDKEESRNRKYQAESHQCGKLISPVI